MFKKWADQSNLSESKIVLDSFKAAEDASHEMTISKIRKSSI